MLETRCRNHLYIHHAWLLIHHAWLLIHVVIRLDRIGNGARSSGRISMPSGPWYKLFIGCCVDLYAIYSSPGLRLRYCKSCIDLHLGVYPIFIPSPLSLLQCPSPPPSSGCQELRGLGHERHQQDHRPSAGGARKLHAAARSVPAPTPVGPPAAAAAAAAVRRPAGHAPPAPTSHPCCPRRPGADPPDGLSSSPAVSRAVLRGRPAAWCLHHAQSSDGGGAGSAQTATDAQDGDAVLQGGPGGAAAGTRTPVPARTQAHAGSRGNASRGRGNVEWCRCQAHPLSASFYLWCAAGWSACCGG